MRTDSDMTRDDIMILLFFLFLSFNERVLIIDSLVYYMNMIMNIEPTACAHAGSEFTRFTRFLEPAIKESEEGVSPPHSL